MRHRLMSPSWLESGLGDVGNPGPWDKRQRLGEAENPGPVSGDIQDPWEEDEKVLLHEADDAWWKRLTAAEGEHTCMQVQEGASDCDDDIAMADNAVILGEPDDAWWKGLVNNIGLVDTNVGGVDDQLNTEQKHDEQGEADHDNVVTLSQTVSPQQDPGDCLDIISHNVHGLYGHAIAAVGAGAAVKVAPLATSGLGGTKAVESLISNLFMSGCSNCPVDIGIPPLNG